MILFDYCCAILGSRIVERINFPTLPTINTFNVSPSRAPLPKTPKEDKSRSSFGGLRAQTNEKQVFSDVI